MTSFVDDVYGATLARSGQLKLKAKRLLALGTEAEVFDACVLLHEAARIERSAARVLSPPSPVTLLTSVVEACWCLIEGFDPPRAAEAWGDVLRARDEVAPTQAEGIVARLAQRYPVVQKEFARTVSASPTLLTVRSATRLVDLAPTERTRARKELAVVLQRFPGATSFYWMDYRLAEADDDKQSAWAALEKARRLDPENPRYRAMSLLVAAWALASAEAERHLAGMRGELNRAGAEVCLMYAHAELTLARKGPPKERKNRWTRAREAAEFGIAQAPNEGLLRNLKATQLLLHELLANRAPTTEVLYRAGLSDLAATAMPKEDVLTLLTGRLRRTEATPGAAAA
jgi:hypothetical protein